MYEYDIIKTQFKCLVGMNRNMNNFEHILHIFEIVLKL